MKLNFTSLSTSSPLLVATLLLGFVQTTCPRLDAADLFQVRALGGGNDITVGGSSLPKLIEHAVTARDAFTVFENVSQYQVSLTYGGVPNALRLDIEDSATEFVARLTSGLTDLDREFRGPTAEDVQDQIEDFLTKDAPAELARLQRQLNRLSKVAVTDGNPHSSTARAAHETYRQFARALPATRAERDLPKNQGGRAGFSILPEVGVFRADGYEGVSVSLPLAMGFRLGDGVGQRWLLDTHAIHTRFLQPAAVRDYATLGADIIFRMLGDAERETYRRGYAVMGAYANLGSGYRSATIRGGMGWQF